MYIHTTGNSPIIIKDTTLDLIEGLQERLLQVT